MSAKKKPRRVKPYGREWERRANAVAREFVVIHTCRDCGSPTIDGYCCRWCGSTNP